MKTVHNTQARDYSHVIQTFWPLLKLSPYRDNSAGRVEGRCGRLHLPTKKPKQQKNKKKHNFYKAGAETVEQKQWLRRTNTEEQDRDVLRLTMATCIECLSASLYTATERTPIFLAVRITRHAISPRLAISTLSILPTPGQDMQDNLESRFFFFPRQQQQQLS